MTTAELTRNLIVTSFPAIVHNETTRSVTLTCVEGLTGQQFSIEFGSGVCEAIYVALFLFQQKSGPFPFDASERPPGSSKH